MLFQPLSLSSPIEHTKEASFVFFSSFSREYILHCHSDWGCSLLDWVVVQLGVEEDATVLVLRHVLHVGEEGEDNEKR